MPKEVVLQMMKDRGATLGAPPSKSELLFSHNGEKIVVIFCDVDISVDYIGPLKEKIDKNKYDRVIIVKSKKLTFAAKSALAEMSNLLEIEIFDDIELSYNLTECDMAPKYELVSESETTELLKMYRSKKSQIPRMQFTDPIRRYYGWKKGALVREVSDDEIGYRVIV